MKKVKGKPAKINSEIVVDKTLDKLKNVRFVSGKPEEISKANFKLSI